MDSRPVPATYLTAGQDYLVALKRLGLTPAFLGWGWDIAAIQWNLVLVTSIIDAGGPLALNRLLFRAYNAEATPKLISPFMVRVLSPTIIPREFWPLGQPGIIRPQPTDAEAKKNPHFVKNAQGQWRINIRMQILGIQFQSQNAYLTAVSNAKKQSFHERNRNWQRFKNRVEQLAA